MPQLGKGLIGKYVRVTLTQLNGIYLWEYSLSDRWALSNYKRKIATSLHFIALPTCTAAGCNSSR